MARMCVCVCVRIVQWCFIICCFFPINVSVYMCVVAKQNCRSELVLIVVCLDSLLYL